MTKSIDKQKCISEIGTFQSKGVVHSWTSARSRSSQNVIQ